MKKFLKVLVLTICLVMMSSFAYATETGLDWSYYDRNLVSSFAPTNQNTNEIRVQLDGEIVDFTDENGNKVEPQIINDRTMVPMRKIFEVFGANVSWSGEEQRVTATVNNAEIGLQINNSKATVKNASGEIREITLDVVPVIKDGRTLVPVRFIAESLDKKVGWDAFNRAVIIIDTNKIESTLKEKTPTFYEYLTADYEKINTYDMTVGINGKIVAEDASDSANDFSMRIDGDMDLKFSKDAIYYALNLKLNGDGEAFEEIKTSDLENIDGEMIIDIKNGKVYAKSPLIEGYADKWVFTTFSGEDKKQIEEMMKIYNESQNGNSMDAFIDAITLGDNMTLSTYSTAQSIIEIVTFVANDNNFKVSGKDTKTYTLNLDLSDELTDLISSLSNEKINIKFLINSVTKVEDKVANKANFDMDVKLVSGNESLSLKIETDAKFNSYNKDVNITIPSGNNVVDITTLEN